MALKNAKGNRLFVSGSENKTAQESAPQTYKNQVCKLELQCDFTRPQSTPMIETNRNKTGAGEHGTRGEIQAIYSSLAFNNVDRLSEIAFLLAFWAGRTYTPTSIGGGIYRHEIKALSVANLELPTFTLEYGPGNANDIYAGCVINDFTLEFPFNSGNGKINGSFNGFCNGHYSASGVFTKLPAGNMNAGSFATTSEPLVNAKSTDVFLADSVEPTFGVSSVDNAAEDLGSNLVTLTRLISSIRITGNNGLNAEQMMRGGGAGIINDWTRGVPTVGCEINLRKDVTIQDFEALILANTQKALEVQFNGPVISSTYRYSIDLFLPVFQVNGANDDNGTPISKTLGIDVFQNAGGDAIMAYVMSTLSSAYNA